MARDSILSDDSFPEDLLVKLRDFPQVPDKILVPTTMMHPPIICVDGRHISGRDSPHLPYLQIDTTLEKEANELQGEGGATKSILDPSRILRGHPGLVMEHCDPTTSVHTFKIASPRRQQDESPRLSSPSTPSLSLSSGNSSPFISTLKTPLPGPFRALASGECLDSCTTFDSLDHAPHPTFPSATGFPKTMPPPLRRSASELSHRPPSNRHRYMSHRFHQDPPPTISIHSSQPSSSTISSALDEPARGSALYTALASYKRESRFSPTSGSSPCLSEFPLSPDGSVLSADQLLAFREFLVRRAEDISNEARSCFASSDPDLLHPGFGDLCGDVASDCSDYGGSILSGRRYSFDEQDNSDGTSTSEDPWSTLSITREMRTWDSPDNYSILANDDTSLHMNARSSSPTSQLESELPQPYIDPPPQRTGSPNPTPTLSINQDALQDFLPNFLDLRLSFDTTGSVANEVSGTEDLPLAEDEEPPKPVPEGSSADARGLEGERPDVMLAQLPPITNHGLRRVQSAGGLLSSHSPPTRSLPLSPDDHRGYDNDKGADAQAGPLELAHGRGSSRRGQSPNPGLTVAVNSGSQTESRSSREVFLVSQRHRAMTLQEPTVTTGTSSSDRLHRSATTMRSVPPALSFQTGSRYRTLEDRAYRHPDVPRSPLYSDLDHEHLVQDAYYTGPSLLEQSSARSPKVSSAGRVHIPHVRSRSTSSGGHSRSATPRPRVPPPYMPTKHSKNDSNVSSSSWKRLVRVHRPGSSLDSNPGSSFTIDPTPSTKGVGLSLVDNGAFEAPRPAPEPRTAPLEKVNTPPSRTVVQRVPVVPADTVTEEPNTTTTDDVPKRNSDSVVALSLTVLSRVWSKKRKQQQSPAPQSSDGLRPRLDSANSSELDLMSSSFINMVENENVVHGKPQRKGLLLFKRK